MRAYVGTLYAVLAGACFMVAAMAAIEYHEHVAPNLERAAAHLAKLPRMLG